MVAKRSRISKRTIDALSPAEKPYERFDDVVKGFGVRVAPTGSEALLCGVSGRCRGARRRPQESLPLGRFGAVTPGQARAAAQNALARVRMGEGPERGENPPAGRADRLRADPRLPRGPCRQARAEVPRKLRRRARQGAGGARLDQGRSADASPDRPPAYRNGGDALCGEPDARGGFEDVRLGGNGRLLPDGHGNPARKIGRYREQGRERFLTPDELARLGDALCEGETVGCPIRSTKPRRRRSMRPRLATGW